MRSAENTGQLLTVMLLCSDYGECDRLTTLIVEAHHDLECVSCLEQALALLDKGLPDVAIVCHSNPGLDAFSALRALRHHAPAMQGIIVADGTDVLQLQATLNAGGGAYLCRPVDSRSLAEALQRCSDYLPWDTTSRRRYSVSSIDLEGCCGMVQLDHTGRIIYRNSVAQRLLHCQEIPDIESFPLAVSRSLRDYQGFQVNDFLQAVASGCPWQGELAGVTTTAECVFECIVSSGAGRGAAACTVVFRDVSRLAAQCNQLRMEAAVAADLLLIRTPTVERGLAPEATPFDLVDLLKKAFARSPLPALCLELPTSIPALFLGEADSLRELFTGLAIHVRALDAVRGLSLCLRIKEKIRSGFQLFFELTVTTGTIDVNSYETGGDYLGRLKAHALPDQGIALAMRRVSEHGGSLIVKRVASAGLVFSFTLGMTEAQNSTECSTSVLPAVAGGSFNLWSGYARLQRSTGLRILVADDSLTDQLCIRALLEGEGFENIVVVGNGREAVEEAECGEYDLVFMDILMPVLDGFEATRLLRQQENLTGKRLTIIALTSYALKAVHDKCLSVGMDGYLSKPVSGYELSGLLSQILADVDATPFTSEPNSTPYSVAIFDADTMMERMMNDRALAATVIDSFLSDIPCQIEALQQYLAAADAAGTERQAHAIKGAAANVSGELLRAVAFEMEMAASRGELSKVAAQLPSLKVQFEQLKEAMSCYS